MWLDTLVRGVRCPRLSMVVFPAVSRRLASMATKVDKASVAGPPDLAVGWWPVSHTRSGAGAATTPSRPTSGACSTARATRREVLSGELPRRLGRCGHRDPPSTR
jgi:hypothetical protein